MTKAEILKAIESLPDDQFFTVSLFGPQYPDGCRLFIQGIREVGPWYEGGPKEMAFLAHEHNGRVPGELGIPAADAEPGPAEAP